MATRKYKKRTQSKKHKKNQSKKHRPRKYRGGCGNCGAPKVGIFGGNANGPIPGPESVPIRYYYGLNDHVQDPNNPATIVDARLLGGNGGNGGKRRRHKQRGGFSYMNSDLILNSAAYNVPASFGSHVQAPVGSGLISGTITTNPSVYEQPVGTKYNENHPALA